MATISDLHKSISSMTNEELEQKFLDIRKNIRITKKAFKGFICKSRQSIS